MTKKALTLILIVCIAIMSCGILAACNKETDTEQTPISYDIPAELSMEFKIMEGDQLLGTLNKSDFLECNQVIVHMDTINDENTNKIFDYVGYKLTDVAAKAGINLPTSFSKLKGIGTDEYESTFELTSIDKAYITIGYVENGQFTLDTKKGEAFARLITDKDSRVTSTMIRFLDTIVFDPIEGPAQTAAYEIALTWGTENDELTAVITDMTSAKSNTIVLTTEAEANTFANIECKAENKALGTVDLGASKLKTISKTTDKGTTEYVGYELGALLDAMMYVKKTGDQVKVIEDENYDFLGFVCSDDTETTDIISRTYSKTEIATGNIIISNDSKNSASRVVSSLDDVAGTYRNNSKKVTKLILYKNAK